MVAGAARDIERYASSVGVVTDRSLEREEILATSWLVTPGRVATCAHFVLPFAECLPALKVSAGGNEFGVAQVVFHPRFNKKAALQLSKRATGQVNPSLALQEYNVAILTISEELPELTGEMREQIHQQLAWPQPPRDKGLAGNLAELDLALVIQTITNARKEGTLVLSDERNRPLARFFCRDGRVIFASYECLSNEAAIFQIVSQSPAGQFFFQSQREPDWEVTTPISRPTDMLLIESHRRLDEIPKFLLDLGGDEAIFARSREKLDLSKLAPEVHRDAQALWAVLDGSSPAGKLWRLCGLDDYAVFQALHALHKTSQIQEVQHPRKHPGSPMIPLDLAPEMPLTPWDEITSMTSAQDGDSPVLGSGHLLGSLRPNDPWHLMHNIDLPPQASGAPLFKEGKVIGMHCGRLPSEANVSLQQFLWIEAVLVCLEPKRETKGDTGKAAVGCTEIARIDCPKCGASTLESARFCKTCGQRLLKDIEFVGGGKRNPMLALLIALSIMLAAGSAAAWWLLPRPPVWLSAVRPASEVLLDVKIDKVQTTKVGGMKHYEWLEMPPNAGFHTGDMIRLHFASKRGGYVYVLDRGTTSTDVNLIYPENLDRDHRVEADKRIFLPAESAEEWSGWRIAGRPGTEEIFFFVSDRQSKLLQAPAGGTRVVQIATEILARKYSSTGLEVPVQAFGDLFAGPDKQAAVYLLKVPITHSD